MFAMPFLVTPLNDFFNFFLVHIFHVILLSLPPRYSLGFMYLP